MYKLRVLDIGDIAYLSTYCVRIPSIQRLTATNK